MEDWQSLNRVYHSREAGIVLERVGPIGLIAVDVVQLEQIAEQCALDLTMREQSRDRTQT